MGVLLTLESLALISKMNKYLDGSLKKESTRIKIIFIIFTTGYILRASVYAFFYD